MSRRTDEYIARLTARLARKLPADLAAQKAAEIRSHLAMAVIGCEAEVGKEAAESKALMAMGSDKLLAEGLVRAHKGVSRKSIWGWAAAPSILMLAVVSLVYSPLKTAPSIAGALGLLILTLAVFVVACIQSRRWVCLPVLAASIPICFVAIFDQTQRLSGIEPSVLKQRISSLESRMDSLSARIDRARELAAGASPTGSEARLVPQIVPFGFESHSPIPTWIRNPTPTTRIAFMPVASVDEARRLWQANGPRHIHDLIEERTSCARGLEFWREPKPHLTVVLQGTALLCGFWGAVFAVLNALVLAAGSGRRRVEDFRWRRQLS